MIWARPSGTVAQVSFKPTAPHVSLTRDRGAALHRVPTGLACRQPMIAHLSSPPASHRLVWPLGNSFCIDAPHSLAFLLL
jgi:hypothetical protein